MQPFFNTAADKIWNCYRTHSKRHLAQQIRRLREWANEKLTACPMKEANQFANTIYDYIEKKRKEGKRESYGF